MLYDLRLVILYAFARPSGAGRQLFRVLPASLRGQQQVLSESLTITPAPTERHDFRDFFDNRVVEVAMPPGLKSVRIEMVARVSRSAEAGELDLSPGPQGLRAELAALRDLGPESPHHAITPSPRVAADAAIIGFARQAARSATTTRDAVVALGRALHDHMTFDAKATDVDTAPEAAFVLRRGVCQDYAQIMIAGLRGIGIPAGYVAGFLRTTPPPGKARLAGADAMHAWARAWCGIETGWLEYDPTNACLVGGDHVVVGYGRDYGDVAPVTGMLRLDGGQSSTHSVDIEAVS